ncbi:MAG TPA: hypothetical protein VFJ57_05325 [Solirubrobacterales bacterium]|nr:hypothetical protein [Solirubrobacterales bacterium]
MVDRHDLGDLTGRQPAAVVIGGPDRLVASFSQLLLVFVELRPARLVVGGELFERSAMLR